MRHLQDLFTNGFWKLKMEVSLPCKGFRSTWQEGIKLVLVRHHWADHRAVDLPNSDVTYADVIAPMIRDTGLATWRWDRLLRRSLKLRDGKGGILHGRGASWIRRTGPPHWKLGEESFASHCPSATASATTTGIALADRDLEFHVSTWLPVGEGCRQWRVLGSDESRWYKGTAHMLHDTEQSDSPRHICGWSVGC